MVSIQGIFKKGNPVVETWGGVAVADVRRRPGEEGRNGLARATQAVALRDTANRPKCVHNHLTKGKR